MSNKSLLITDVPTSWNLTYEMIIEVREKRKVLNAMVTTCQKDGKENILVTSEEWDLLKMFANELLAFLEAIEIIF